MTGRHWILWTSLHQCCFHNDVSLSPGECGDSKMFEVLRMSFSAALLISKAVFSSLTSTHTADP